MKRSRKISALRSGTAILATILGLSVFPHILMHKDVIAEWTKTQDNTCLGTSRIAAPVAPTAIDSPWSGSYVYYGKYASYGSVKYRVLDPHSTDYGAETLFLDCDTLLFKYYFDEDGALNPGASKVSDWKYSDLRSLLNDTFVTSVSHFTAEEQAAIANSQIATHTRPTGFLKDCFGSYTSLYNDKLFVLDVEDLMNPKYGYYNDPGVKLVSGSWSSGQKSWYDVKNHQKKEDGMAIMYWTRSSSALNSSYTGICTMTGSIQEYMTYTALGVAPAMNLQLSSILFSTAVNGNCGEVGTEYTLTLQDNDMWIKTQPGQAFTCNGSQVTFPYHVGGDNVDYGYILSVLVTDKAYTDKNANILYYNAVAQMQKRGEDGILNFTLPDSLSGEWGKDYHVYVLLECDNPGYETDTASAPFELEMGVAINETNFPDEAFRTYVSSEFDLNKSGILSYSEIENANIVYCDGCGIKSMQGIEFLTEVTQISCINNQITSLNLSQNKKLQVLCCYKNNLTELALYDVPLLKKLVSEYPPEEKTSGGYTYLRSVAMYDGIFVGIEFDKGVSLVLEKTQTFSDFIDRLYQVALNREPEADGKAFWMNKVMNEGFTGGRCAIGFLIEAPEFLNRDLTNEQFVEILYQIFFDRKADEGGKSFWLQKFAEGMTRAEMVNGFIDSIEWCNLCATFGIKSGAPNAKAEKPSSNAVKFATRLYTECLGREYDNDGLMFWALRLTNLESSGYAAALGFFTSDEFKQKNIGDDEFIHRLYRTFMDRDEDADGFAFWKRHLGVDMTREDLIKGFAQSQEFTNICNEYGIDKGI